MIQCSLNQIKFDSSFNLVAIRTQGRLDSDEGQWSVCLFERGKKFNHTQHNV